MNGKSYDGKIYVQKHYIHHNKAASSKYKAQWIKSKWIFITNGENWEVNVFLIEFLDYIPCHWNNFMDVDGHNRESEKISPFDNFSLLFSLFFLY